MKKVALYLRLSKEDEFVHDESNSIQNQRKLLRSHIKRMPEFAGMETIEIKDDGYSGKNMNRPGMQELLSMVKRGRIEAILCKDLSRFSRDYLTAGRYLEQIFPFMGVRFIAVGDNYDSRDFTGGIGEIDVAFKGILYDYYSEDLSMKIKSSLISTKRSGKHQAHYTPYGYRKDPEDKYRVLVDAEAAVVVRELFDRVASGEPFNHVMMSINEKGIEPLSVYKERKYGAGYAKRYDKAVWSAANSRGMLEDEFYIGTFVFHKYETLEMGSRKPRMVPKDQWERIYIHHEAIVDREVFDAVQKILAENRERWLPKKRFHYLKGKVICGECGANMQHVWSGKPKYVCRRNYQLLKQDRHELNSIRDEDMERVILKELEREAALHADGDLVGREAFGASERLLAEEEKRLEECEAALEKIYEREEAAYEDFRSGVLDEEKFLAAKETLAKEAVAAKEAFDIQKKAFDGLDVGQEVDAFHEALTGIGWDVGKMHFDKMTPELGDLFVKRIVVLPGGDMNIEWKFREN